MGSPKAFLPNIGEFIENYEVQGKLGEGAFGNVYLVKDSNGRKKALKLLKLWTIPDSAETSSILKRFRLEYETGLIDSEHLVHSENYGFIKGNPFIVMEFCPKGDLRPYVDRSSSINFIQNKAVEILKGLRDLHSNGKIHRDLKPENVLLDANNQAKLTDFGISGHKNMRVTKCDLFGRPLEMFGTHAYLPPEQLQRTKHTKLFTLDIYSFGVVFYELLTGNLPFGQLRTNNDLAEYKLNTARGNIIPISKFRNDIPSNLESVIKKCIQPNPKDRYQTTGEVLAALGINSIGNAKGSSNEKSPSLKVMFGIDTGTVFGLNEIAQDSNSNILNVGRNTDSWRNDLFIREPDDNIIERFISRKHATLEKHGNDWIIRDGQWDNTFGVWKSSLNGTFVNSQNVGADGIKLTPGDIVILGDTTLKFN